MRTCIKKSVLLSFVCSAYCAAVTVNSTLDNPVIDPVASPDSTAGAGVITLRSAIEYSNVHPPAPHTLNAIDFAIPGMGVRTITVTSALPSITGPVLIDGYSQPHAGANTLRQGSNAQLAIELTTDDPTIATGLVLDSGANGSQVRGLIINNFIASTSNYTVLSGGIVVVANNTTIAGNFIGTDSTGTVLKRNRAGVTLASATTTTVGGASLADRNVIAGCYAGFSSGAIYMIPNPLLTQLIIPENTVIENNLIGTDRTGTIGLGSSTNGINGLANATLVQNNTISSHSLYGIVLNGANNTLISNLIGTDVTGTKALPNANGIGIIGNVSSNVTIKDNTISGNLVNGIAVGFATYPAATNTVIAGNLIGTDSTGTMSLPNGSDGIRVVANTTTIGGVQPEMANTISGNGHNGITLTERISASTVTGNRIGADLSGTQALPNGNNGIQVGMLQGPSTGAYIGANTISANRANGISVESFSSGTAIQGNSIGFDSTGQQPLGNKSAGVQVAYVSSHNTIGGAPLQTNYIGNNGVGVRIGVTATDQSIGNQVSHNSIYANSNQGIDLAGDGPTLNHATNPVRGAPNYFQNYPVLRGAVTNGVATLQASLHSVPQSTFRIELFSNPVDRAPLTEGRTFITALTVTTDSAGNAQFTVPVAVAPGGFVSGTATLTSSSSTPNGVNSTSEFSPNAQVSLTANLALTKTGPAHVALGQVYSYTVVVTNKGPSDAHNVAVTDTLDQRLTLVNLTGSGWIFNRINSTITAIIATIAAGSSAEFIITVQGPEQCGFVKNQVTCNAVTPAWASTLVVSTDPLLNAVVAKYCPKNITSARSSLL